MADRDIDNNATGVLILIIPIAFAIILLFKAWPILLFFALLSSAWSFWQRYQLQKLSRQLNPMFHQLILENQGCITALDLAMKANLSGRSAERFLNAKAEEFAAQKQIYEDRGTVYYFITANTLGKIFDASDTDDDTDNMQYLSQAKELFLKPIPEPETTAEISDDLDEESEEDYISESDDTKEAIPRKHPIFQSLIQSELARRLRVHSSTVMKRRDDPSFTEWSRRRDPEGIAWEYSPDTREFFPIESKSPLPQKRKR
ncbi:hypothetical protein ACE1B6_23255 [Aerosakkonemataceae cyanobacterium BLCC-F154]|uniref:Uncharacterized protein n=1 Tax=Floridaenema fluviatile BLCC-F154 TaxID=3153640 RepID=A0ABV4YK10_9CYAN